MKDIKKVLLLGSGAIKIGEAGEFDYSGSQAIKALKEEGIKVILVNPNIATIQTSRSFADEVYFLPITPEFVTRIIEKERPQGILLSFGGQTALNCGIGLHKQHILHTYDVRVLGTPIEAILATEDRKLFSNRLNKLGILTAQGRVATTEKEAHEVATSLGYPLMVRSGFALGGAGSGVVTNDEELSILLAKAFAISSQIVIEESLYGWKEIEYEVVRDVEDNCITVCNMENFDPVGIHTGESIVVAPSQTLTNEEYYSLRQKSIDVIRNLQIIGECNIQFALNPKNSEIRVIEVNARLSRSSALASKATGYPLAYVAAKLAIGKTLPSLSNKVTQKTTAFFEPALDYVVVKMPRWDLDKFIHVDQTIGSEMKSVGEVMAIGRTFTEAIQKAARSLLDGYVGVIEKKYTKETKKELLAKLKIPTSTRLFTICSALASGISIPKIQSLTQIDPWFIRELLCIVIVYKKLKRYKKIIPPQLLRSAKQHGFSDRQIADCIGTTEEYLRKLRKKKGIIPTIQQIDTTAGEFPAKTNYLYLTYNANNSSYIPNVKKQTTIVLGCGPYAIGTSVEFDWCAVNTVLELRNQQYKAITINCNPETVSTDFDISDILYFEELTLERVLDIVDVEKAPVIVSVGGQIANNLATKLAKNNVVICGTNPKNIERAENRKRFSALLDSLGILQPPWAECRSVDKVLKKAKVIGFPILARPSFVLSGKAMSIIDSYQELTTYLGTYPLDITEYPLVISKFYTNATECDVDGVSENGKIIINLLSEHVEEGGVHSGDSTLVLPAYSLSKTIKKRIKTETAKIVRALALYGPFNIQYLIVEDEPLVIECNARASRSMPFVSKATGTNFITLSTRIMIGAYHQSPQEVNVSHYTVKVPQFSYHKLRGADPIPRIEMSSTGEVAAFDNTMEGAFLKAFLATGVKYPVKKAVCLSLGGAEAKLRFLSTIKILIASGWTIYATSGTALFLKENGIVVLRVGKASEGIRPSILDLLRKQEIDFSVVIPDRTRKKEQFVTDGYSIRRLSTDLGLPVFTNIAKAQLFIHSVLHNQPNSMDIQPWSYYVPV